ncbi:MAG: hypothetical protein D6797_06250, partial [Bdellovibrio sp.]
MGKSLGQTDKILLWVSGSLGVLLGVFLIQDQWIEKIFFPQNQKLAQIGQIKEIHNDVRRRQSSSLTWLSANQKEVLYNGDSIFTGKDSEASLELEGGNFLHLEPNSLVVLDKNQKELALDLQLGSVELKLSKKKPVTLKVNNHITKVRSMKKNSVIQVKKSTEGKVHVISPMGAAELSVNGKKEKILPQQLLEIDTSLNVKKSSFSVSYLRPERAEKKVLSEGNKKVRFLWKTASSSPLRFQISLEPDFSKIIEDRPVAKKHQI